MKKIIAFFSILSCMQFLSLGLNAQAIPKFESLIYNFGNIEEDQGPVSHEFSFTNMGPGTLLIDTVEAECGCTSSSWTETEIAKEGSGKVLVVFDPEDQSGSFQKQIKVSFSGISNPETLRIIGNVVPGMSDPEEYFKKKIGATRFRSNYLNVGNVPSDTAIMKSFGVYNDSDTVITFLEQIGHATHMEISVEPMSLKPGETGMIHVLYDARKLGKLGYQTDMTTFATDENNRNAMKYLSITANVEYVFPEMTEEEKKKAPNISFEKKDHDFGDLISGQIVETSFNFTNTGKEPLKILQTSASCGCTAGVADKEVYQPGESGKIDVNFNSRGRNGNQHKYITVFTNSPLNPKIELRITADVKTNVPEME